MLDVEHDRAVGTACKRIRGVPMDRGCCGKTGRPVGRSGRRRRWSATSTLCQRRRCPRYGRVSSNREGCALKHQVHWSRYCDCEVWEKPEGKLLRIIGILPRFTDDFKRIYRMRTGIERYFRSSKHSRLLDRHQFLEMAKVSLNAKVSRLAYLATALARLKANDYAGMRLMTVRLPRSRRERGKLPPELACNGADCVCCSAWAKAA